MTLQSQTTQNDAARFSSIRKPLFRWFALAALAIGVASIFIVRTTLARTGNPPQLFDIFNMLILLVSAVVVGLGYKSLTPRDWLVSLAVSTFLGLQVSFSSFYPLISLRDPIWTSLAHGGALALILLAGLAIARRGGPVVVLSAQGNGRGALKSFAAGTLIGLPFAAINAYAFSVMENRPLAWQPALREALNALQPGVGEEVVYRLALLGVIWLVFLKIWPGRAVLIAATFSLIIHNYAHFDALFRDQPLFALGYGALTGLVFGLPMTLLALRRDLETAAGFHWVVDFLRFLAGF